MSITWSGCHLHVRGFMSGLTSAITDWLLYNCLVLDTVHGLSVVLYSTVWFSFTNSNEGWQKLQVRQLYILLVFTDQLLHSLVTLVVFISCQSFLLALDKTLKIFLSDDCVIAVSFGAAVCLFSYFLCLQNSWVQLLATIFDLWHFHMSYCI